MTTRTGMSYLPAFLCNKCNKFYGYEGFGWLCSYCSGHAPSASDAKERADACAAWTRENTLGGQGSKIGLSILRTFPKLPDNLLYSALIILKKKGIYLAAADAVKLLGTITRGHIIGSVVADWWNIKTPHVGGEWPAYLACYYGQFDSAAYPVHPQPRNRDILYCTETAHLRALPLPAFIDDLEKEDLI